MPVPVDDDSEFLEMEATLQNLRNLPYIRHTNVLLLEAISRIGTLLSKRPKNIWTTEERNALARLQDALEAASSLAVEWKRRRLRLLLGKNKCVADLYNTVKGIMKNFNKLKVHPNYEEEAKSIVEQLGNVLKKLGEGGYCSELNTVATDFKEKLLGFLRLHGYSRSSEHETFVCTWLAEQLETDIETIRQELQELNEHTPAFPRQLEEIDSDLWEQVILLLTDAERHTSCDVKTKLKCGLCGNLMTRPVVIDSGMSFCKGCIEEYFQRGRTTCPVTDKPVSKRFVVSVTLQDLVVCCGGDAEPAVDESTEEADSSDVSLDGSSLGDSLERRVERGLAKLCSGGEINIFDGFAKLFDCTSSPEGKRAVFNAQFPSNSLKGTKAIPTAMHLAKKQGPQYSKEAMKLMWALTSDINGAEEFDTEIVLEVADELDVLIAFMKGKMLNSTPLLAAETLVNILKNKVVRKTVLGKDGIVPAFLSFLNVNGAPPGIKDLSRVHRVCIQGLPRLAKTTSEGEKSQLIVKALIALLMKGFSYLPGKENLVEDTLVELEKQLSALENPNSKNEICILIRKGMEEILKNGAVQCLQTVVGRMAVNSIMSTLCELYPEQYKSEDLILYLLFMIRRTSSERENTLDSSHPREIIEELLVRSVKLLSLCATHGRSTVEFVLTKNTEDRNTLGALIFSEETSANLAKCRYESLRIFELVGIEASQATDDGDIAMLVKWTSSVNVNCRRLVASKLRHWSEKKQRLSEIQDARVVDALLVLLKDEDLTCKQDALVAFQALSNAAVVADRLPLKTIVSFFNRDCHSDVICAATGLLDLMFEGEAVSLNDLLETEALDAAMNLLNTNRQSLGSDKGARALLKIAQEHEVARHRIASARLDGLGGLKILMNYVNSFGSSGLKDALATTLVSFCKSGETCEAVIEADGLKFLLSSLENTTAKQSAAEGLLELVKNIETQPRVLEAGFVSTVCKIVRDRSSSTAIALSLEAISSTSAGLDQIYSEGSSVTALITLLEKCPSSDGVDAAAAVIARLYPRLQNDGSSSRLSDACNMLVGYLRRSPLNRTSQVEPLLQALAVFAKDPMGKVIIHESKLLTDKLSITDAGIQSLVLKILVEMCARHDENGRENPDYRMRRNAFMDANIGKSILDFIDQENKDQIGRTESLEYSLVLIRNFSCTGTAFCKKLLGYNAVSIVLDVLKRQRIPFKVIELSLLALQKFVDIPEGRLAFMNGGVEILVSVLRVGVFGKSPSINSLTTFMLMMIARDPPCNKDACTIMFRCHILESLQEIVPPDDSCRGTWLAAAVMKLLAMYGPTTKVCKAMVEGGSLRALFQIQSCPNADRHCFQMASEALKFVEEKNKDCKKYIQRQGQFLE